MSEFDAGKSESGRAVLRMSIPLLLIVSICYVGAAVDQFISGHYALGTMFASWAIGTIASAWVAS